MILIAIGSLTLLASLAILWRRAVEMRLIRWKLYGLRDELRLIGYENPELVNSGVFQTLDTLLTLHSAQLNDVSLWTILPRVIFADRQKIEGRQRDFETRLYQSKNAVMIPIYKKSSLLFARHLAWRHLFLTALAFVTILGIAICYHCGKWFASRIASGAVQPIVIVPSVAEGAVAA